MQAEKSLVETEVTRALEEAGVAFEIRQHERPALSCDSVAIERGLRISQIVKCMVGRAADGALFAMLLPGDKLLKLKKARKHIGMGVVLVPREELAADLGLIVGAISPVQMVTQARILMDPTVLDEDYVDVSSGHPLAGVALSSSDLRDFLKPELVEIVSTSSRA